MTSIDKITARILDQAGDTVSGLDLTEIGEDAHRVANLLWKIASYLRQRNPERVEHEWTTECGIAGPHYHGE